MKVTNSKVKERHRRDAFILIERRKGRMRLYLQVALCVALIGYLVWLMR